jgi:histidine triad (HIT) family protein
LTIPAEGKNTEEVCGMLDGMDCLFCKIAAGAIPSKKVFEDELAFAIVDIKPQAPVHALVIPKKHISSLAKTDSGDNALLAHLLEVARDLAKEQKLGNGYRVVINTGTNGGQTVDHLHLHVLGGRAMHWPPG